MRHAMLALAFLLLATLACTMPRGPAMPAVTPTLLVLADLTPSPAPRDVPVQQTYTVTAGDTLGKIAIQTGSSAADLAAANALADPDQLFVGQVLYIPAGDAPSGASAETRTHTVAPGETLDQIARQYGVSASAISLASGVTDPDRIYAGQTLTIPGAADAGAGSRVYLNVPIVMQSHKLSCESASACSLMRYAGYACGSDMDVFNALPRSYDNPRRGFVGPVDDPAGTLPPGAAAERVGGYGAYVEPIQAALAALGAPAQYTYNATLEMLRSRLDQGAPALIIATHGMGMYGHAPVTYVPTDGDGSTVTVVRYQHSYAVVGYDDAGFWVIDPWSGSVDYFDNAAFDADWARLGRQVLWVLPG